MKKFWNKVLSNDFRLSAAALIAQAVVFLTLLVAVVRAVKGGSSSFEILASIAAAVLSIFVLLVNAAEKSKQAARQDARDLESEHIASSVDYIGASVQGVPMGLRSLENIAENTEALVASYKSQEVSATISRAKELHLEGSYRSAIALLTDVADNRVHELPDDRKHIPFVELSNAYSACMEFPLAAQAIQQALIRCADPSKKLEYQLVYHLVSGDFEAALKELTGARAERTLVEDTQGVLITEICTLDRNSKHVDIDFRSYLRRVNSLNTPSHRANVCVAIADLADELGYHRIAFWFAKKAAGDDDRDVFHALKAAELLVQRVALNSPSVPSDASFATYTRTDALEEAKSTINILLNKCPKDAEAARSRLIALSAELAELSGEADRAYTLCMKVLRTGSTDNICLQRAAVVFAKIGSARESVHCIDEVLAHASEGKGTVNAGWAVAMVFPFVLSLSREQRAPSSTLDVDLLNRVADALCVSISSHISKNVTAYENALFATKHLHVSNTTDASKAIQKIVCCLAGIIANHNLRNHSALLDLATSSTALTAAHVKQVVDKSYVYLNASTTAQDWLVSTALSLSAPQLAHQVIRSCTPPLSRQWSAEVKQRCEVAWSVGDIEYVRQSIVNLDESRVGYRDCYSVVYRLAFLRGQHHVRKLARWAIRTHPRQSPHYRHATVAGTAAAVHTDKPYGEFSKAAEGMDWSGTKENETTIAALVQWGQIDAAWEHAEKLYVENRSDLSAVRAIVTAAGIQGLLGGGMLPASSADDTSHLLLADTSDGDKTTWITVSDLPPIHHNIRTVSTLDRNAQSVLDAQEGDNLTLSGMLGIKQSYRVVSRSSKYRALLTCIRNEIGDRPEYNLPFQAMSVKEGFDSFYQYMEEVASSELDALNYYSVGGPHQSLYLLSLQLGLSDLDTIRQLMSRKDCRVWCYAQTSRVAVSKIESANGKLAVTPNARALLSALGLSSLLSAKAITVVSASNEVGNDASLSPRDIASVSSDFGLLREIRNEVGDSFSALDVEQLSFAEVEQIPALCGTSEISLLSRGFSDCGVSIADLAAWLYSKGGLSHRAYATVLAKLLSAGGTVNQVSAKYTRFVLMNAAPNLRGKACLGVISSVDLTRMPEAQVVDFFSVLIACGVGQEMPVVRGEIFHSVLTELIRTVYSTSVLTTLLNEWTERFGVELSARATFELRMSTLLAESEYELVINSTWALSDSSTTEN